MLYLAYAASSCTLQLSAAAGNHMLWHSLLSVSSRCKPCKQASDLMLVGTSAALACEGRTAVPMRWPDTLMTSSTRPVIQYLPSASRLQPSPVK